MIASLPPLRKALITVFQCILPPTTTNSRKTPPYGNSHSEGGHVIMDNLRGSKAYRNRIQGESVLGSDNDSDRAILDNEEPGNAGIMKRMTVTVKGSSAEPELPKRDYQ